MPNPVTQGLAAARSVRRNLGYEPLQPIDPAAIAERLGVLVVRKPLYSRAVWGMHLYDDALNEHIILINSSQPHLRQRFTLAHELGHAQFDKDTVVESLQPTETAPEEKRANAFAGELLMPEAAVKKWAPQRPWGEDPNDVARIALHFGVSYEATLWKLFNAQLLRGVEHMRDLRSTVDAGFRAQFRAPGDELTEYPERYSNLAKTALERNLISEGRYNELLATEDEF